MSHQKLKEILTRRLKLKVPLFRLEGRGRISGSIVSASFVGKRDYERQRMIWDALDAELGAASVREVGMLLAYTPDEYELPLEGNVRPRREARASKPRAAHKKAG